MRRHQAVKNVKSWWPQDTKSGWQSQQPRPGLQITVGSCTKIRPHLVQKRTYLSGKIHQLRVESMKCRVLLNKALFMTVHSFLRIFARELGKGFSLKPYFGTTSPDESQETLRHPNVCFCNRGSWPEKVATSQSRKRHRYFRYISTLKIEKCSKYPA